MITVSTFLRQSLTALRTFVILTVVLGIAYPLVVTLAGQVAFGRRADGQMLHSDGRTVGSALIGQSFTQRALFHSRPSAGDYDGLASGPSNLGPSNPELLKTIRDRKAMVAETEGVPQSQVPPDAVTASASGLDPFISPAYAAIQVRRVAVQNGLPVRRVRGLVDAATDGRRLGFLGEPTVNVLRLNLAVRAAAR